MACKQAKAAKVKRMKQLAEGAQRQISAFDDNEGEFTSDLEKRENESHSNLLEDPAGAHAINNQSEALLQVDEKDQEESSANLDVLEEDDKVQAGEVDF